jgi:hypothetical protein
VCLPASGIHVCGSHSPVSGSFIDFTLNVRVAANRSGHQRLHWNKAKRNYIQRTPLEQNKEKLHKESSIGTKQREITYRELHWNKTKRNYIKRTPLEQNKEKLHTENSTGTKQREIT